METARLYPGRCPGLGAYALAGRATCVFLYFRLNFELLSSALNLYQIARKLRDLPT